jgi:peptidyl-prolyl cis-trans isomerase SurA
VKELIAKMQAQGHRRISHRRNLSVGHARGKAFGGANATIMDQLRQGGSFVAYARQYSEASTKVVGGDLGWALSLPTELAAPRATCSRAS